VIYFLFTSCSYFLSHHMGGMSCARQKAIAEKRRRGIQPYCRKRTLTPRAIVQSDQTFARDLAELNSKNGIPRPTLKEQLSNRCGAPLGNRNAWRHGKFGRKMVALRKAIRAHIREGQALIAYTKLLAPPRRVRHIVEIVHHIPRPRNAGERVRVRGWLPIALSFRHPSPRPSPPRREGEGELDWGYPAFARAMRSDPLLSCSYKAS